LELQWTLNNIPGAIFLNNVIVIEIIIDLLKMMNIIDLNNVIQVRKVLKKY